MRRVLEGIIILFKEDIKIADASKATKDSLLKYITNKKYFSKELISYFNRKDSTIPFKIEPTDPTQVVALKKILNALENTEAAFRTVESINISQDRHSILIISDVIRVIFEEINKIYTILKLINESSADIQSIVGPYIQKLLPKIKIGAQALEYFTPKRPDETLGENLGIAVKMLPTQTLTEDQSLDNLSHLIYQIPHYFEELQKLISKGSSGIATRSITSTKKYQAAVLANAALLKKDFEKISTAGGILPCLNVFTKLISLSTDLVNTGAPLTKQAYLDAVAKLEDVKHNILPQLISELEMFEERMGLKPGLLTDPALAQIDAYYTQLANQVDSIAYAAGVLDTLAAGLDSSLGRVASWVVGSKTLIKDPGEPLTPTPNLNILMDDEFVEKRMAHQLSRLNEAKFKAVDNTAHTAAKSFFKKVAEYNSYIYAPIYKWSLANLSQTDKDALIADYKKFQAYFAEIHPEIDKLIVDALTKPTGSNIVSRLWDSEYKQLWGKDHFNTVCICEKSVLENINHKVAEAHFQEQLIRETMIHAEETPKILHIKREEPGLPEQAKPFKTILTISVIPFKPLALSQEEQKSADDYHNLGIAVACQITQLEQAKNGVMEFLSYLDEFTPENPEIASLDEAHKEKLRIAYKKFQTQLVAMPKFNLINTELINSLNSDSGSVNALELHRYLKKINKNLNDTISQLEQNKDYYISKEHTKRQQEDKQSTLEPKGVSLGKKTLFGIFNELKLSESLDEFFNNKFQKYLKDNLSPTIWKELSADLETIETSELPFLELHKDTPEVAMYKNLINSIYNLKSGLKKLEDLYNFGDPSNIIFQGILVGKAADIIINNILPSKYYLQKAAENPSLKKMVQEGLDLLEPLKYIPIMGDYIKQDKDRIEEKPDIIIAWQQQQELVKRAMSIAPKQQDDSPSLTPSSLTSNATPTTTQPFSEGNKSYLELIAESLYQVPIQLNKLQFAPEPNPEETAKKIKEFVDGLNSLTYYFDKIPSPDTIQKILTAQAKVQIQISEIAKLGLQLTFGHLKEIQSEFSTLLLEAADKIEFNLGLKPGTYSNIVSERFNKFYSSLIANLPFEKDQTGLELLIDATSTQKRLTRELERLESTKTDSSATDTEISIFGCEHTTPLYQPYVVLKQSAMNINGRIDNPTIDELRIANEAYQNIQPYLVKINSLFTKDYILKCNDPSSLSDAIDTLFKERLKIHNHSSNFDKIMDLYLNSDFSKEEDKVKFLRYYEELRPILSKVEWRHEESSYKSFFLRELQTPEDFTKAAENILKNENKLQELIAAISHAKEIKKQLCKERIEYFKDLLETQEHIIGKQKIENFKENLFSKYINANIESLLAVDFVQENTEIYLQEMMKYLLANKADILKDITLKDDIEEEISAKIKKILPKIKDDNKQAFKELIFNNYIKNLIPSELGIYKDLFIQKIIPEFLAKKDEILSDVDFDKDISKTINSRIDAFAPSIFKNHVDLKKAYSELNQTYIQINKLLEEENNKAKDNPCRIEKIELLETLKDRLVNVQEYSIQDLTKLNLDAKNELKSLEHKDALISIYDVLESLKKTIEDDTKDLPLDKTIKLAPINEMLLILAERSVDAPQRLKIVVEKLKPTAPLSLTNTSHYLINEEFKSQLYINYINTSIKIKLQQELGLFGNVLLQKIMEDLISKKTEIIKDLTIENINELIGAKVEEAIQDIFKKPNYKEFTELCKYIDTSLVNERLLLQNQREMIKKEEPHLSSMEIESRLNKCRIEKISALEKFIEANNTPEEVTDKFLQSRLNDYIKFNENLEQYDQMIKIYEHLHLMQASVDDDPDYSLAIKREKTKEITKIQHLLIDNSDTLSVAERLDKVKEYGSSKKCEAILFKNASYPFINLCKVFYQLLSKIIPIPYFENKYKSIVNEEYNFSIFKQQLSHIKENSQETPEAQPEESDRPIGKK